MANKLKTLTVKLPEKWVDHLEHLEKTTTKSKNYYVKEALYRHLEDIEDYQIGAERSKVK